ncbi:DUF6884 domain-containing protein [Archangium violaceum]|uniref:DUF6884 domain-containing protein n=1 Tax=Archangium violaceum TaxID=83451 RepID=UPI0036D798F8
MRGQLDLFFHTAQPEPIKVARVALVACGKTKRATAAPAGELYTGALVRMALEYARRTCEQVFILSAKHGVLALDTVVEPYDETLVGRRKFERLAWGERVAARVQQLVPPPADLLLLAGSMYLEALQKPLLAADRYMYSTPLAGQGIGEQLAWLKEALAEMDEGQP